MPCEINQLRTVVTALLYHRKVSMSSTRDYSYVVRCETPGCVNQGKVINIICCIKEKERVLFEESYGHGAQEEADYCQACHQLGSLVIQA